MEANGDNGGKRLENKLMMMLTWHVLLGLIVLSTVKGSPLIDASGALRLGSVPDITTSEGVVVIIHSPGTPSSLLSGESIEEEDTILSLRPGGGVGSTPQTSPPTTPFLVCRGATLRGTSAVERNALSACSLVGSSIILDGITMGDVESGFCNSRHARTLTTLFRARVRLVSTTTTDSNNNNNNNGVDANYTKQTLILSLLDADDDEEIAEIATQLPTEVEELYRAAAVERKGAPSFQDVYDVHVVSSKDPAKVLSLASEVAAASASALADASAPKSLQAILLEANGKIAESSRIIGLGIDTPYSASAFVAVGNAHRKQVRAIRANVIAWQGRISRGLWVDRFGTQAITLRDRILQSFDADSWAASGLPLVASYRLEMRAQIQAMVDTAIEAAYASQVENLEKATVRRLQADLLKTVNDPVESVMESNAAALRKQSFTFDTAMKDLQVPELGLTKDKASRAMTAKLNDALMSFPDSPVAKIKRAQLVKSMVSKEKKKPAQRAPPAVGVGVDLVAVLRPDGFGSVQGFAGYQLPGGHSITFGVHNDADDPQVISQFGGVRPPLLRVQPKLRIDVEL